MLKRIPLAAIYGNPNQPRKIFDASKLVELAASIRENGLKQPITVRPDGEGKFMIVMGERRFRAHQLLADEGGVTDILCQVSKVDDAQLAIDAIIENDQRVDVSPLEQARSYQRMIDLHGYDVETLAKKLGKAPFRIDERLRLLTLNEDCQQLLAGDQITALQAWYLSTLSSSGQARLLKVINAGLCPTTAALKAATAQIAEAEAQVEMFAPPPPPSKDEVRMARNFEQKVDQLAAMLRAGIDDNTITAVRKVAPEKAAQMADLFAAMQVDLKRLEAAFRAEAVALLAA
jgi:ParB family chromosome partitioning protein